MNLDFEIWREDCIKKVGFAIAEKVNITNDILVKGKKPYSHAEMPYSICSVSAVEHGVLTLRFYQVSISIFSGVRHQIQSKITMTAKGVLNKVMIVMIYTNQDILLLVEQ